jgi:hypothetical protein
MSLQNPTGICTDGVNLFICDTTNFIVVKMVIADPTAYTLLAGSGSPGFVDGTGAAASFKQPTGIAYDSVNNCVYVADIASYAIRKITMAGVVTTIAGNGTSTYADGPALGTACVEYAPQLTCDAANGLVYFTEQLSGTVRRLNLATSTISTIIGSYPPPFPPLLDAPIGIKFYSGSLYIATSADNAIYTYDITTTNFTNIIAGGNPLFTSIFDIIPFNTNIYLLDTVGNRIFVYDTVTSTITAIAGAPDHIPGFVNGTGDAVRFNAPQFFTSISTLLYVSDTQNNAIRTVSLTGTVGTTNTLWRENNNVLCLVRGTPILTPSGYVPVEKLQEGDHIQTSDGRRVSIIPLTTHIDCTTEKTAPYKIPAHCLGRNAPVCDLVLSPGHAFEIRKGVWQFPRIAAQSCPAIKQFGLGEPIEYFHIICPNYAKDNLVVNGAVIESLGLLTKKEVAYTYNPRLKGYTRGALVKRLIAH